MRTAMLCIPDQETRQYTESLQGYDEAVGPDGAIAPEWAPVLEHIHNTSPATRRMWSGAIRRDLREDGLTFTMNPDPLPSTRQEDLDPIPWVFTAANWAPIDAGIAQRARLLETVARDLLGPRDLIRKGLIPADLLFAHAGYLRACVGVPANLGAHLFHYAADLARGPDGRMWVLDDKTQAPSGAGYALENRTILGRMFPDLLGSLHVHRLASWFRTFRRSIMDLHQGRRLDPRVVMLTPGPYAGTYFEHAYLAAYLGYTLVQGDDLVMREGSLWLKTLEGLQPVDILIRRVDAEYCDPLELRRDSFLGVAGLLGAMRNRRAACVNHPGIGVLENRGLLPFLPGICREVLGEDPILPSAATWWCGQPKECQHVLANLRKMVIKPIDRNANIKTVYGGRCTPVQLEALRNRILARPMRYVGQEQIGFSTTPMLPGKTLEPRRSVLRVFACAKEDNYAVMPGGLGRAAADPDSTLVSIGEGGILKDVWVLSDKPDTHRTLWVETETPRDNTWFGGVFTSRSADHLFWVGRYAERIARQVRLLRGMVEQRASLLDDADISTEVLAHMADLMDHYQGRYPEPEEDDAPPPPVLTLEDRLSVSLQDKDHPGTVIRTLQALMFAAYGVRDVWSQDSWRILTTIETAGKRCCRDVHSPFAIGGDLDELIEKLYAFYGLNSGGMTRESGWGMLMLGRTLEAAIGLIELLEGLIFDEAAPALQAAMLDTALSLNENLITYRRHYRTTPRLDAVLDLVLSMDINPRALVFHISQLIDILDRLPPPTVPEAIRPTRQSLRQLRNTLMDAPWRTDPSRAAREALFLEARQILEQCSAAVTAAYFNHTHTRALEAF
ncbi:MAG: circularly permuted type 2 ATP-grasp protein [Verrucomicrobia bacterium]|nr:circularly permuted type 2 ATP-grasp protein [Verrucomicrobiota bacterium]MCH8525829.1 circularly permuted type 2 ATP-grasp protein [Kiritimatiellia bacterium]